MPLYKKRIKNNMSHMQTKIYRMKTITIYLLVIVSASCLLAGTEADTYQSDEFAQVAAQSGFISGVQGILRTILSTVHGVECLVKEVIEVMNSTIVYLEEIEACGTAVPKEIAKIVKNCRKIIELCENIIHLNSTLCASDDDSKVTGTQCFVALLKATTELVMKIDSTVRLIENLPGDTESCFVDATEKVEDSYNNFIPKTNICIDEIKNVH